MGLYDAEWKTYRRLWLISLLGLLGALPTCFLVYTLSRLRIPGLILFLIWAGYVLVVFGAWLLLNYFRCPHCNELFASTGWGSHSVFARKCAHCGLKKFSDGPRE